MTACQDRMGEVKSPSNGYCHMEATRLTGHATMPRAQATAARSPTVFLSGPMMLSRLAPYSWPAKLPVTGIRQVRDHPYDANLVW